MTEINNEYESGVSYRSRNHSRIPLHDTGLQTGWHIINAISAPDQHHPQQSKNEGYSAPDLEMTFR